MSIRPLCAVLLSLLFLSTEAVAQDLLPGRSAPRERATPRAPKKPPARAPKVVQRPAPLGGIGRLPKAPAAPAKAQPPTCERELWRAARAKGRLGALLRPLAAGRGWLVRDVIEGSLGAREGLLPGDVVLGITGAPRARPLRAQLSDLRAGQRFSLRLRRDGRIMLLPAVWNAASPAPPLEDGERCVTGRVTEVKGPHGVGQNLVLAVEQGRLPPRGSEAALWWALEKPHGGIGPGVKIGLGRMRVGRVVGRGLPLETLSTTAVTYNGERISVPEKGKPVHLRYEDGELH